MLSEINCPEDLAEVRKDLNDTQFRLLHANSESGQAAHAARLAVLNGALALYLLPRLELLEQRLERLAQRLEQLEQRDASQLATMMAWHPGLGHNPFI